MKIQLRIASERVYRQCSCLSAISVRSAVYTTNSRPCSLLTLAARGTEQTMYKEGILTEHNINVSFNLARSYLNVEGHEVK